jgi:hypothetical protein
VDRRARSEVCRVGWYEIEQTVAAGLDVTAAVASDQRRAAALDIVNLIDRQPDRSNFLSETSFDAIGNAPSEVFHAN